MRLRLTSIFIAVVMFLGLFGVANGYQVKLGTRIHTDFYWAFMTGTNYRSAGDTAGTLGGNVNKPDITQFYCAQPSTNFLRVDFTSDDQTTGARIEFGLRSGWAAGANRISLRKLYGWYKFGRCKLVVGKNNSLFATLAYAPYQWLGLSSAGSIGDNRGPTDLFIGWGKQTGGFFTQIGRYYYRGPWTFMAALGMPALQASSNVPVYGGNNGVVQGYAILPSLKLAVQYKGKYFSVAPAFSIYETRWEPWEGARLEDDRVLSYLFVLPFRFTMGRFGFTGELSYGQNWWAPNSAANLRVLMSGVWWGGQNDVTTGGGQNQIKFADTYMYAACIGFYYKIGKATVWLSGGFEKTVNGSSDAVGTWRHGQNTRYAFVFAVPYKVNRHFTIAPEIGYFYYGWNPFADVGPGQASMYSDLGSVVMAGVVFKFFF